MFRAFSDRLDDESFLHTLRPKYHGLLNLLASVDLNHLKLLVTFGSVIARIGMRGEADYAVANEWMGRLVERFQQKHPMCRCLNLEWSVWSGVGMGPRLGSITPLIAQGISPISPDAGVQKLIELLADPGAAGSMIVTGRYGDLSTLKSEAAFHPARFLAKARCFYPGVELVADTDFSLATDPYLADHVFRGRCLLPGVVGLEMMAEAAGNSSAQTASARWRMSISIIRSRFRRTAGSRSASPRLARPEGRIDVVLRSSATRFAINHFTAVCRPPSSSTPPVEAIPDRPNVDSVAARLDPKKGLYGRILFQGKTFQRIEGYELLRTGNASPASPRATPATALVIAAASFSAIPPAATPPSTPSRPAFPTSPSCPFPSSGWKFSATPAECRRLIARERHCDSTGFVYDLSILSENGDSSNDGPA